jgi:hypothetical protein
MRLNHGLRPLGVVARVAKDNERIPLELVEEIGEIAVLQLAEVGREARMSTAVRVWQSMRECRGTKQTQV